MANLIGKSGFLRYVEYVRILKSIELICNGEKKVYFQVGYTSPVTFSISFLRVTGFNMRYLFTCQSINHKSITKTILNAEAENPKKSIETIINDVSIKCVFSRYKKRQQSTQKDKLCTQKDKLKIDI